MARTVFLGSAPLPAAANRGIDDRRILLGSVQPGETPATFGDALRKLAGQATYLYENAGRYWYATQPSVNQLARDRAEQQADDRVEMEIERRLKGALADRGPFARVHPSPKSGSDVPDEDEVALVALGPGYPHDAKAATSKATTAAGEILASRGAGARMNQNMLVFLVADHLRLAELTPAVREYLAWSSIVEDGEAGRLNLDASSGARRSRSATAPTRPSRARIPETYQWLLVPEQADPLAKVALRPVKVSGSDPLAVRAGAKLRNEEHLITKFGGVNLRLVLDGALKEKWSADHAFGLKQLWSWFAQYPYLPRLRDMLRPRGCRAGRLVEPPVAVGDVRLRGRSGGAGRVPRDRRRAPRRNAGHLHEPHRRRLGSAGPVAGRRTPEAAAARPRARPRTRPARPAIPWRGRAWATRGDRSLSSRRSSTRSSTGSPSRRMCAST